MKTAIGITDHNINEVVTFLNILLADEYVLYTKTRNANWNADGSKFYEQHVFFENQYNVLDEVIDDLAERIRSLGCFAIGSLKYFQNTSQSSDENYNYNNLDEIIQSLASDHEAIIRNIRNEIIPISDRHNDTDTVAFVTNLLEKHEKMVWMHRLYIAQTDASAIEEY
ncbi:MAG TPA: DNA starvation/stationary phase protection protein [Prolixibacteraceae bacterium]|nr:DNA starvation/stationary phase protection protein [Prolixibacteraceae bacterium]